MPFLATVLAGLLLAQIPGTPPPPTEPYQAADYRLHDLLGVAGATVGFVLAGAILMGGFFAKYTHLLERYRGLTTEMRGNTASPARRSSLLEQIAGYRRRTRYLHVASASITLAVLMFIFTVMVASLSVIYPTMKQLRFLGTVGVVSGLVFSAVAVALDLVETLLSRAVINEEVIDIPDLPADTIANSSPPPPQPVPQMQPR